VITDVTLDYITALSGIDGLPVASRRIGDWSDAEGLAIGSNGRHWVSFERWARVAGYDGLGGKEITTKSHTSFADYKENQQLEALAIAPDGTLYAFAEAALEDGFAIYKYDGAAWAIDGYLPKSNRRVVFGETPSDDVLWTSGSGDFDNLEGIAVWPEGDGLRITMVADNNAEDHEITQFVELKVVP